MIQKLFTHDDINFISEKGIPIESIEIQLENFRKGFQPISLHAPATEGNGIIHLREDAIAVYAEKYKNTQKNLRTIKFVPASGAASRMFKSLFEFLEKPDEGMGGIQNVDIDEFIGGINRLALAEDLKESLRKKGMDLDFILSEGKKHEIIRTLLNRDGMNYGNLPKGLIKFHKYQEECRTSFEEHLVEGAAYCLGGDRVVNLHFTVSSEHLDLFKDLINKTQSEYEQRYGVRYHIEFSLQRSFTDTIAVDTQNQPFRDQDGSLLFRPGGHGALLANLNDMDADLIFIKNIDNVCPDRMKPSTYLYKRALAGILLEFRQKAFNYFRKLDDGDHSVMEDAKNFLSGQLGFRLSESDDKLPDAEKKEILKHKLNRPMRVCGMVRNEGEPGGGPFWTLNRDGSVSLQIVESSQIDFTDIRQSEIAGSATHFNPVDLVCATRDYEGKSFDLNRFTDPETGLISSKSRDGKILKAQELPGLWNGSMANWNTMFIEVPMETFNPVKTIMDLLRPQHIT